VAGYDPAGDPSRQPTRRADINDLLRPPAGPPAPDDSAEETGRYGQLQLDDQEPPAPTPWYRKRVVLIAWGLLLAALIALIIYGLVDLTGRGPGEPTPTPTSTTEPTTTTTTVTTPTTTSPSPSSSTEEPPPNTEPTQAPAPQPRAPGGSAPPSRRHRLPKLPPTISVPGGPVITIPPGF
jgi:hypothetical protein